MPNKPHVLHLIWALDSGGCENMLVRTLPHLKDFEHTIIALHHGGELVERAQKAGIKVTVLNIRGFTDLRGYQSLFHELRQQKPKAIFSYLFHADAIGRLIVQPCSLYRYSVIPFLRTTHNHPQYRIARIFERLTWWLTGRFLANSEAVQNFYSTHLSVSKHRITVLPNGIDTAPFQKATPPRNLNIRGVENDSLIITCVANFHPYKGHRYLLEAFAALHKNHQNLHLLLVGDGAERNNLEAQSSLLKIEDRVHFLGRLENVAPILTASHIFVLPSDFEGMSNALMEAMASGLACLASDIPENAALITPGKTGLLFKKGEVRDLTQQLATLVTERTLRQQFGKQAQTLITSHFDLKQIASEWTDYIEALN